MQILLLRRINRKRINLNISKYIYYEVSDMKIVTIETLGKMPIGTVFTTWQPNYADEDLHIKTGGPYTDGPSWNG